MDLITDLSNLKVVTPLNHKRLKNVYSTLTSHCFVLSLHFLFSLHLSSQTLENGVCVCMSVCLSQLEQNLKSALHVSSVSSNYCYSVGQLAWLQGQSITHDGFDLYLRKLNFISFCDVPQSPWVANDRVSIQSPRISVTTTNVGSGAQVLFPVSWVVTQAPPGLVVINSCKAIHIVHHMSRTDWS